MFNWIRVRGVTTTTGGDGDGEHGTHNIRVFAQVEGRDKQAIATQGDVSTGFSTREDACASGCLAACERASSSAMADDALENCRVACSDACTKPDASGKFSCVVYPDTGVARERQLVPVTETATPVGMKTSAVESVGKKNAAGAAEPGVVSTGSGSGSSGLVNGATSTDRREP